MKVDKIETFDTNCKLNKSLKKNTFSKNYCKNGIHQKNKFQVEMQCLPEKMLCMPLPPFQKSICSGNLDKHKNL